MEVAESEHSEDYLAEYDFFQNQRKAHLKNKDELKILQNNARRKAKKDAALSWTKGGKETLKTVQERFQGIKLRLQPHHYYRSCMEELSKISSNSIDIPNSLKSICRYHSYAILRNIRQSKYRRRFSMQSNLIVWKHDVHKQLLDYFHLKHTYNSQFWFVKWAPLLKIVRFMFRYYMSFVILDLPLRTTLYKKRDTYKKAKAKLDLIDNTINKCEYIGVCKSIQHYHTKGCSNCGVIWMGGTLKGAVPYVVSYSRDTGVPTLVTLEFEKETLANERVVQIALVEEAAKDLAVFEEVVFMHVRLRLQRWWSHVLAYKRVSKLHRRIVLSKKRHTHRRLLVLKKEIDLRIKEPQSLLWQDFFDKYCDIKHALIDYIQVQNDRKDVRLMKVTHLFYRNLKEKVELARERRYQEWLRLQSLPPPEKPIVIKQLPPVKPGLRLICYRPGCNMRKFLTKDRFNTHMKVHQQDDLKRYATMEENIVMKRVRELKELKFLDTVQEYREEINSTERMQALVPVHESYYSVDLYNDPDNASLISEQSLLCLDCQPSSWLELPHRNEITSLYGKGKYFLELVSRSIGVLAPNNVPLLPNSIVKIGTSDQCECVIQFDESQLVKADLKERISYVHCMLFHDVDEESKESRIYVLDNRTVWGTYMITRKTMAMKVPKQGKGTDSCLQNGYLLCLAVAYKGEKELSPVTASEACIVYRLQYQPNDA